MERGEQSMDAILLALRERAKELRCLYAADEILSRADASVDEAMGALVAVLPSGWQFPDDCVARIRLRDGRYESKGFVESPWALRAQIVFEGEEVGEVAVHYTRQEPAADEGPFLHDERRLINAVAERIGHYVMQRRLRRMRDVRGAAAIDPHDRFKVVVEFLRSTDRKLLVKLTRRMVNHLSWSGIVAADELLHEFVPPPSGGDPEDNRPVARGTLKDLAALAERTFRLAAEHLEEDEVLGCIRSWIQEDRASFLYGALENLDTPLTDLAAMLERFHAMEIDVGELPIAVQTGLKVALIRRFFTDDLAFVQSAKDVVEVRDFLELAKRTVMPPDSHGKLGGKCAGLFLAGRIAARAATDRDVLDDVRIPKTWYVASDALLYFVRYNELEEVYDRKYREIEQIRREYPYLVQLFKASPFPPELSKGLSAALDEFGGRPIIVRSSSLLEDRVGSAFAGKYKSLFLANQGSKARRLAELQDAIAEVYASVFGPDPIEYRARRGLLDVHEEMAILIQEVVGTRVGPYFLPTYSGVAYGNNEFRWSSRIRREDGLMRLVPGLGTRAVDRLSDDYTVLVAPGQPSLRVNATPEEVVRYAPKRVDVIDLEAGAFATIDVSVLLRQHGRELPAVHRMVSKVEHGLVRRPIGTSLDFENEDLVVTFEGLIADTPLVKRIRILLERLRARVGFAVDLEFASNGEDFYLLQCRAQGYSTASAPASIPADLPPDQVVFSADRHVSNGKVPDVTHVVYVDEDAYAAMPDVKSMRRVGEVVGRLNKLLPPRQFILVGPGRWGSRGDIRLGVSVTYSQINNTAMLIEVARQKGSYVPDVSFGTHFFQDLVESEIRYLPLYPDSPGVAFDTGFFRGSHNSLVELLPQYADVAHVVRVIDVRRACGGRVLRVLQNADLDLAVAYLAEPDADPP